MRAVAIEVDEKLLVEAAKRDPSRFAELYEHNFDRVYAYVARRVSGREEAEDVTSEVFHQALASIAKFEWRGSPFVAWLLGIAAKVLASRWRTDSGAVEVPADSLEEPGADDEVEQRAILARLVETLPPDQRQVIVWRFVDQRSISDIAKELKRSEGAVKQLQFRALQALRARVKGSSHE